MHFLDDSLLPENQQKLVIQVASYGPQWLPAIFPKTSRSPLPNRFRR